MDQTDENILKHCSEIDELYTIHIKLLGDNNDVINQNRNMKYMCFYSSIMFGYGKEISILQKLYWNTSVESLGRDFLETYSIFKNLSSKFENSSEYDKYLKGLVVSDFWQEKTIYNEIKKDMTYVNMQSRDFQMNSILERIEKYINDFFPLEVININKVDYEKSLFTIINRLNKKYSKFKEANHKAIGKAISSNSIWETNNSNGYEGAFTIYGGLCHFAHQNISSIEDRLISPDGNVMLNMPSRNIHAILSLVNVSLRDNINEIQRCIASLR